MTSRFSNVVNSFLRPYTWLMVSTMIAVECLSPAYVRSQSDNTGRTQTTEELQQRVGELESEVAELKRMVTELQTNSKQASVSPSIQSAQISSIADPQAAATETLTPAPQDKANL